MDGFEKRAFSRYNDGINKKEIKESPMKSSAAGTRQLIFYFGLTFLLSYLLWLSPVLDARGVAIPAPLMILGQLAVLGPAIAAFVLTGASEGKAGVKALFRRAWSWKFKKRWLLAILLLPFAVTAGALGIKLLMENSAFAWGIVPASIPLTALIIFFAGGLLEEFGWRGYALPRLLKAFPAIPASLLLGVIHVLWHLPLCFIPGTVQSAIPFWEFSVVTVVGAVLYTWIYQNTGGSFPR